ncbi:MAG: homoserine O-acetyltransferase [Prevotella sp.]|nr:homoserine O-acetyltransferase [Bacteroides sp.]MCM1366912.1 homoserine O-acetyltransferase [Prevotella sp.]MCM1436703.1 homoserine O-acetyltransferase [Prevotella sp.]
MSERKYLHIPGDFSLDRGGILRDVTIAYHTFGELNECRDNVVWVCHALTADSNVADWWPHTVVKDGFLDPAKYFVVCANILGSPYGSTSPCSIDPLTGNPYYNRFPKLSIKDWVKGHQKLAEYLGIGRIKALVGSSVGGFQALEWLATEPDRFDKNIILATAEKATPWAIAINETQRMSILADCSYGDENEYAGAQGLAAARAIGLLTYRGGRGYNVTQQDWDDADIETPHRACTYQQYQGEKLVKRFNAYSYMAILDAFDTHNVGRNRGGVPQVLSKITGDTIVIGISTDMIFPPDELKELKSMIPGAEYKEIESEFGHDGFLVEHQQLNNLLVPFMNK